VLEVTADNFETEVAKSAVPVVIDFWAEWCSPCKQFAPTFEKVSKEFAGKMVFAKCDIDANQEFAQSNGVMSIPCIIVFKNGKEAGRMVGNQTEDLFRQQLKAFL
jgi:thioredoxin 1